MVCFNVFISALSFYHLLTTGSLKLEHNFDHYNYLKKSGCVEVESINDKEDFVVVEVSNILTSLCTKTLRQRQVNKEEKKRQDKDRDKDKDKDKDKD